MGCVAARTAWIVLILGSASPPLLGQATEANGPAIPLRRIEGAIRVDGQLDEPAWAEATRVEEWFETNPGDNLPPTVGNVAWLVYDGDSLYAAFRFDDPEPRAIRAPFGDHDLVFSQRQAFLKLSYAFRG
jgi:hypothetical protein